MRRDRPFVAGRRRTCGLLAIGAAASTLLASPARAQTAPGPADAAGYRDLHAAAWFGNAEEVRRMVSAGATLDARDGNGRTPLHVATFGRKRDAVRALLEAGANTALLDNDRYDAVTIAAVANDEETLRLLLQGGASARLVTSRYAGTALIAAAHLGHEGVVRLLIEAGAPLDRVNNLGWTAVCEAVVLGDGGERHQQTLRRLLDAGADPNIADRQGQTPLALARARGLREIARLLENAGGR